MRRRVEATPKQQLAELRRAYERYAALADQLNGGVTTAIDAKLQRALAQDAYRIAAAYKKSVANSCARMESPRPSEGKAKRFALMTTGVVLIVAIIGVSVFTITYRPELVRLILPLGAPPAITRTSAMATKGVTSYVPVAEKPILSALVPERTSAPVGPVQALDGRHTVVAKKSVITDFQTTPHPKAHKSPGTQAGRLPVPSASIESAPPASAESAAVAPGNSSSAVAAPFSPSQSVGMSTQLLPTHPSDTNRSIEQGVTQVQISSSAAGVITDCHVVESSGSLGLDASACSLVQRNWQAPPITRSSQFASGAVIVSVIWNLRAAK